MTLLRTALHYAGATALLLAATRLANALPKGPPRVVSIDRGVPHFECAVTQDGHEQRLSAFVQSVSARRLIVVDGAVLIENYVEDVNCFADPLKAKANDKEMEAAILTVCEPFYQRAEARAARGDRPDSIEAA